jgi:hypothetical protein
VRVRRRLRFHSGCSDAARQRRRWLVRHSSVHSRRNARHAGRDDYRGEGVPSTGSDAFTIAPGVRFRTGDRLELYGYVQVPLYQNVNEAQLAPRAGFVLGFSKSF